MAYYELMGIKFREDTIKENNGKIVAVYFEGEIGGLAYHLVQN